MPSRSAEVDKDEPAVVAAGGNPATERDFLARVFGTEGVAMMGAVGHGGVLSFQFVSFKNWSECAVVEGFLGAGGEMLEFHERPFLTDHDGVASAEGLSFLESACRFWRT
jgi:hypothetical protein